MNTLLVRAPERKGIFSGNYTEDGKPMFYTVEWSPGEKQEYLNRIKREENDNEKD
jgi:hypothetical protein